MQARCKSAQVLKWSSNSSCVRQLMILENPVKEQIIVFCCAKSFSEWTACGVFASSDIYNCVNTSDFQIWSLKSSSISWLSFAGFEVSHFPEQNRDCAGFKNVHERFTWGLKNSHLWFSILQGWIALLVLLGFLVFRLFFFFPHDLPAQVFNVINSSAFCTQIFKQWEV